MKNFKIGKKLFFTFGVILAILLVTIGSAFYSLSTTSKAYDYANNKVLALTDQTLTMRREIQAAAKSLMYAITTTTGSDNYISQTQDSLTILSDGTQFLYENSTIDKSVIDNFNRTMETSVDSKEHIFDLIASGRNEEALSEYYSTYYPLLIEANKYLVEITDYTNEKAAASYIETQRHIKLTYVVMSIIAVASVAISIILALYITRSLTTPIKEIESAANQMAAGNLQATVTYTSKDELGSLSNSIRTLITNLQNIIGDMDYLLSEMANGNFTTKSKNPDGYIGDFSGMLLSMRKLRNSLSNTLFQINQSADQVSAGSDQVSSGSQALSQGATEQASSIEELAATINEISSQVKENAQNAQKGSEVVLAAGNKMEEGNRQMQKLIAAMAEITERSGEIGKIIKTIEDIAFQTNILALNAAVEAARAGAAGKGFAVVADEVRNLASKSAEASKSTASLIEGSIHAVEQGTQLADETARILTEVVESAKHVVITVGGISEASNQQALSINQVTQGIDQISSVVQTNSATAEESAAASEELSGQAEILKNLVGQFQLLQVNEGNPSSPTVPIEPKDDFTQLSFTSGKY